MWVKGWRAYLAGVIVLGFILYQNRIHLQQAAIRTGELQEKKVALEEAQRILEADTPLFKQTFSKLLRAVEEHMAPQREVSVWCYHWLDIARKGTDLQVSQTLRGRSVPEAMNIPWSMYNSTRGHVRSQIIPYCVDIQFSGTMTDIVSFFTTLELVNPASFVGNFDLRLHQSKTQYDGTATIFFPAFLYDESLRQMENLFGD